MEITEQTLEEISRKYLGETPGTTPGEILGQALEGIPEIL